MNIRSHKLAAAVVISGAGMLLATTAAALGDREAVGYVFDSIGDWLQDGVKFPHKSGDPVYAGAVVTLDPAYKDVQTKGAAITINLFNGKREERSSEQPSTLAKPIQLPSSLGNQSSALSRLLRAMGALFSNEPDKYLITTVRGVDELRLHDAVVELRNGEIDLRPVFNGVRAGKYLLRLSRVDLEPSKRQLTGESFTFDWRPAITQRLSVSSISPGLWRIDVLQANGERSTGTDAWMLVRASANYEQAARLFDEAVAVTSKWGNNVSESELRSFERTALDALAHQQVE